MFVFLQDGILVGAVGAYDWNGAVLKETRHGKVIPPKSSYLKEFPEELKNHAAYLGKKMTYKYTFYCKQETDSMTSHPVGCIPLQIKCAISALYFQLTFNVLPRNTKYVLCTCTQSSDWDKRMMRYF